MSYCVHKYCKNLFRLDSYIPIILGVRRPKKLIGFESEIEFFHFVIKVDKESIVEQSIIPDSIVFFQSHREPISSNLAQKLSLNSNQEKTVFIGAGALGSKLLFHYARGGNFNLKAIDNDTFSPHNIVRHDLFMESSGKNKARAVIEKIKAFLDNGSTLEYHNGSIFNYDRAQLEGYNWLIDTSASLNVQNWLVNSGINIVPNRARAEIAYKGQLGFLYIEGENQNPRIDDLVNYAYFLGTNIEIVSEWLIIENKKQEGNDYDIVDIGIGCNSPTVIMANDSMSFHSSIFSKILNHESKRKKIKEKGFLNVSFISENGFDVNSKSFFVPPFDIFKCNNNSGWEIRLVPTVLEKMKLEAKKYKRHETGGIFIGICNYKTKTIQVFDTITAPPDSKHSPVYFYRGIENLPEQVEYIKEITGGMIGYIGEWHTHPMGLDSLSGVDEAAVEELKPLNDKYPIPTFISILSKEKYLPFVF
ncbi:MAG: ThiF family adenylyltransferase [Marinilabiliaceae bacterium]|nr:ThiF family adenylyltransferase [Marinilabiliaceae bacterium]